MTGDTKLAIYGGTPVRTSMLPYAKQAIDENDIAAVVEVLRSEWLTTGPEVERLEAAFAARIGTRNCVAVSSGTAALHAAMFAAGVGPGDEVIVPAITFVATANSVVYLGGRPVFADVGKGTLLIDPDDVAAKVTSRTKAIVAVDYAGQPCDYQALRAIAAGQGLAVIDDACHSLGAKLAGEPAGRLASLTAFSLHPVKHITAGEGGIVTTDSAELARRIRMFRNHGIVVDHRERAERGTWQYDMIELGYNYRITDFQCALARSQLSALDGRLVRRHEIAGLYDRALLEIPAFEPLFVRSDAYHAYHLYVVRIRTDRLTVTRDEVYAALRAEGIAVNVHYSPVHLHTFYRRSFGTGPGLCPVAEREAERILTLPLFPAMSDDDANDVVAALRKVANAFRR